MPAKRPSLDLSLPSHRRQVEARRASPCEDRIADLLARNLPKIGRSVKLISEVVTIEKMNA
jgi:hypothetical protein